MQKSVTFQLTRWSHKQSQQSCKIRIRSYLPRNMSTFIQDSCKSCKSFPQKLYKILTLAQTAKSCKILVRFQNYKQLSRARIMHIATVRSSCKTCRNLSQKGHFTWTFLGRQLQDFYWDLNLCALKKLQICMCTCSQLCCRSQLSSHAMGQTRPVTQPGKQVRLNCITGHPDALAT